MTPPPEPQIFVWGIVSFGALCAWLLFTEWRISNRIEDRLNALEFRVQVCERHQVEHSTHELLEWLVPQDGQTTRTR